MAGVRELEGKLCISEAELCVSEAELVGTLQGNVPPDCVAQLLLLG